MHVAVASSAKMVGSSDGGSFVLGHQYKSATDSDGVLVKYNKEGIKLWERVWGGDGHDHFDGVATTYDGVCVVVGSFASATVGAIDSGVPLSNNGSSDAMMVTYPEVMIFDDSGNGLKKHDFIPEDGERQVKVGGVTFNAIESGYWDEGFILAGRAESSFGYGQTGGGETKDKVKAGKTGVGQSGKSVAKNSELLAYILATTAVTAFAVMLVVRRFNAEER